MIVYPNNDNEHVISKPKNVIKRKMKKISKNDNKLLTQPTAKEQAREFEGDGILGSDINLRTSVSVP